MRHHINLANTAPLIADILRIVRKARFSDGAMCPHCKGRRVARHGTFSGRQRFRCRGCRRTFSDLTGTPLAYSKKLETWPTYLECYRQSHTLRAAAARAGLALCTSFRRRHTLMRHAMSQQEKPGGWVELLELRLPHSEKGNHNRGFTDRTGSRSMRYDEWRQVMCVLLVDRRGVFGGVMLGRAPAPGCMIGRSLRQSVGPGTTLTHSYRQFRPVALGAAASGLPIASVPNPATPRDVLDDTDVRHVAAELIAWLERFRGVASRHLERYFAYFTVVRPQIRTGWLRAFLVNAVRPPP